MASYGAPSTPSASANVTKPNASDLSFIDKVSTATPMPVALSSDKVVGFVMPAKNADGVNASPKGHVPLPAGRAVVQRLRRDHGEERGLLQVLELRQHEWVFVERISNASA